MKQIISLFMMLLLVGSIFPVHALSFEEDFSKITGNGIFDGISNFFSSLFGRGERGAVISQDEESEEYLELKPQCPDPKCLVDTDQGYQCLDSGDGFFNFKDEKSNVCVNGNLQTSNEELCITDISCKHEPIPVDKCLYYFDQKFIIALPIYSEEHERLASEIPQEGVHYRDFLNDNRWNTYSREFLDMIEYMPSASIGDRSNGRITYNSCIPIEDLPDKKEYIDLRAGNDFGSTGGICNEAELISTCGNVVDNIKEGTGVFETPTIFSKNHLGYANSVEQGKNNPSQDQRNNYNANDDTIFTSDKYHTGSGRQQTTPTDTIPIETSPTCNDYNGDRQGCDELYETCTWNAPNCVDIGITGSSILSITSNAVKQGFWDGINSFFKSLFGTGSRGSIIVDCSNYMTDRNACENFYGVCEWNNGCFPVEEETAAGNIGESEQELQGEGTDQNSEEEKIIQDTRTEYITDERNILRRGDGEEIETTVQENLESIQDDGDFNLPDQGSDLQVTPIEEITSGEGPTPEILSEETFEEDAQETFKETQSQSVTRSNSQGKPISIYDEIEVIDSNFNAINEGPFVYLKFENPILNVWENKNPVKMQVQWGLANDLMSEPFEDRFLDYKEFYDVGKGIYSLSERTDEGNSYYNAQAIHKGNAFCRWSGTERNDCLLNNRNYLYRARYLDGNNVPLSNWHYDSVTLDINALSTAPYVERLRQVEIDKAGCNEFKWEDPGIETKIIEPFGIGNVIKWRMPRFDDLQTNPVNFRIEFHDGNGWYDVGVVRSDDPIYQVETKVFRPHNNQDLYRFTEAGEVNYHKGDKIPIKEWQIPHLGYTQCRLDGKDYASCLEQGVYTYRIRVEDVDDGSPLSNWFTTDWINMDYKFWYLISNEEKDRDVLEDLSESTINNVYTDLDGVIRMKSTVNGKFKSKLDLSVIAGAEGVSISDESNPAVDAYREKVFLFHSKTYKYDQQNIQDQKGCSVVAAIGKPFEAGGKLAFGVLKLPLYIGQSVIEGNVVEIFIYTAAAAMTVIPGAQPLQGLLISTAVGTASSKVGTKFGDDLCGSKCAFVFGQIAAIAGSAGVNAFGPKGFQKDVFVDALKSGARRTALTQTTSNLVRQSCETLGGDKEACGFGASVTGSLLVYSSQPPGAGKITTFGGRLCGSGSKSIVCDAFLRSGYGKLNSEICKQLGVDSPEGLQACETFGQLAYDALQEKYGTPSEKEADGLADKVKEIMESLDKGLTEEELAEKKAKIREQIRFLKEGEYVIPAEVMLAYALIIDPENTFLNPPAGGYNSDYYLGYGNNEFKFSEVLANLGYGREDIGRYIGYFEEGNVVMNEDTLVSTNYLEILEHERFHRLSYDLSEDQLSLLNDARDAVIEDYIVKKELFDVEYEEIILSDLDYFGKNDAIKDLLDKYDVILRDEYGTNYGTFYDSILNNPNEFYPYIISGQIGDGVLAYMQENFPESYELYRQITEASSVDDSTDQSILTEEKVESFYDDQSEFISEEEFLDNRGTPEEAQEQLEKIEVDLPDKLLELIFEPTQGEGQLTKEEFAESIEFTEEDIEFIAAGSILYENDMFNNDDLDHINELFLDINNGVVEFDKQTQQKIDVQKENLRQFTEIVKHLKDGEIIEFGEDSYSLRISPVYSENFYYRDLTSNQLDLLKEIRVAEIVDKFVGLDMNAEDIIKILENQGLADDELLRVKETAERIFSNIPDELKIQRISESILNQVAISGDVEDMHPSLTQDNKNSVLELVSNKLEKIENIAEEEIFEYSQNEIDHATEKYDLTERERKLLIHAAEFQRGRELFVADLAARILDGNLDETEITQYLTTYEQLQLNFYLADPDLDSNYL